jgi:hypothetical protein
MKLVLHTLVIFSITLAAAGVVALQVPLEEALPSLLQQAATTPTSDDR